MPTYVYRFLDSDDTIEVQQSFQDEALTEAVHPVSGILSPVRKVFTPVGITFKGDGFYKTDNRGKRTSSAAPPSESKSETKSESTSTSRSAGSDSSSPPSSSDGAKSGANGHSHSHGGQSHSH